MTHPLENEALKVARSARQRAYAPYSKFRVGAAVILKSGRVVAGCNVENATYGATVCAERTALWTAVATHGERDVEAIVIVAEGDGPVVPCALCLQIMAEFCAPSMPIVLADMNAVQERTTFGALLPRPFGPGSFTPP
ncbi:MAG: cytidine deaminase [Myxococcota bacterium]|nr:cytidine deaminase [Myxococcota bacterium]